jgi:hypothetical protein
MHRPTRKFIESHDVIFDEGGHNMCQERIILEHDDSSSHTPTPPIPLSSPVPPVSVATSSLCPKHTTHPPIPDDDLRYDVSSYGHRANITQASPSEPKTYVEAIASPNALKWLAACEEEMRTWKDMDVYDIVPLPKGHKVVGSKWVFHVKQGPDGSIQKYKARIVAQGFTQVEGIDFDQTFAPVAKFSSLRTIFSLAAQHNLKIHQMDVKVAYLNAELKEEIYMRALPGFNIPEGHVLRLKKGVYGMSVTIRNYPYFFFLHPCQTSPSSQCPAVVAIVVPRLAPPYPPSPSPKAPTLIPYLWLSIHHAQVPRLQTQESCPCYPLPFPRTPALLQGALLPLSLPLWRLSPIRLAYASHQ